MTQPTVIHMTGRNSGWISKLNLNQKAASHAAPAAITSCRKASTERPLMARSCLIMSRREFFPAPVDRPHRQYYGQRKRGKHHKAICWRLVQANKSHHAAYEH